MSYPAHRLDVQHPHHAPCVLITDLVLARKSKAIVLVAALASCTHPGCHLCPRRRHLVTILTGLLAAFILLHILRHPVAAI